MPHNILLTGRPGIGKTTVIQKVLQLLGSVPLAGFTTAEIRSPQGRLGFYVTTLDGRQGILAHVNYTGCPQVGRYGVDVVTFESLVLPTLDPAQKVAAFILDEIGKMECLSADFCQAVLRLLEDPRPVLGTIALRGPACIQEIRRQPDVHLVQVTRENRDRLPAELAARLHSRQLSLS